jgi:hypothetical protein
LDKTKLRNFIITGIVALCVIGIGIAAVLRGHGEKITMNPDGTVGNLAGNVNNGGNFVEYRDKVYFSNSYDGDSLYIMDPDETNIKKISTASVKNLLAGGEYLYFFQTGASGASGLGGIRTPRSFVRCRLDGTHGYYMLRSTVTKAQLVNNYLYILGYNDDGDTRFYKVKIDLSDEVDLADYIVNPASAVNGQIYYVDTVSSHNLYRLNTSSDTASLVLEGNMWDPIVDGDYIYYLDLDNNYQIRRYSMSSNTVEILCEEKVQFFNEGYGYIYYQTMGQNSYLGVMNNNGSNARVLASGEYNHINLTSRYVYFKNYFDETAMYHSPLGSGTYTTFSEALDAAMENIVTKEEDEEK